MRMGASSCFGATATHLATVAGESRERVRGGHVTPALGPFPRRFQLRGRTPELIGSWSSSGRAESPGSAVASVDREVGAGPDVAGQPLRANRAEWRAPWQQRTISSAPRSLGPARSPLPLATLAQPALACLGLPVTDLLPYWPAEMMRRSLSTRWPGRWKSLMIGVGWNEVRVSRQEVKSRVAGRIDGV